MGWAPIQPGRNVIEGITPRIHIVVVVFESTTIVLIKRRGKDAVAVTGLGAGMVGSRARFFTDCITVVDTDSVATVTEGRIK